MPKTKEDAKQKNTKKAPVEANRKATSANTSKSTKKPDRYYDAAPKMDERVKAAPAKRRQKKEHTILKSVIPYVLMLFSIVLLLCMFTVHVLQLDTDGAGIVGYYLQWIFCGLLGVAAFISPFVLFFIGLKLCLYNIKTKDVSTDDNEQDHLKLRSKTILQIVMASVAIVLIAALIGVFSEAFDSFEFGDMWIDAADDLVGGGIIGGALAVLMIMAFERVISIIILIPLIAIAVIFAIGLTPDKVIVYIKYKNMLRRERKEEMRYQQELLEREQALDEQKRQNRLNSKKTEPEEIIEEDDDDYDQEIIEETVEPVVVATPKKEKKNVDSEAVTLRKSDEADEPVIAEDHADIAEEIKIGEDFGGDPVFDNTDFDGLTDIMNELEAKKSAEQPILKIEDIKPSEDQAAEVDLSLIENEELLSEMAAVAPDNTAEVVEVESPYIFPPFDMLEKSKNPKNTDFSEELQENAKKLMETLKSFKVNIKDITYSRGPTITRYELKPEAGTRVRAIANLVDDIALNLATTGVRIEAPIPNKPAVGIEVPNRERATVYLSELIDSPKFTESKSKLTSSLGMDVGGNPIYFDIAKMPHLLIAGATGMGKSVCINSIIVSLLYKAKPDEVKLILIDPKKVEFNIYKDIPHLYAPIVSDPKKAAGALASAVAEMERRFELIEEVGVRDIATYNSVTENDPDKEFMPQMVIIIDELADLMMTAPDEVESSICRLAQKARAAGIHIIIGTQRPSVDVITGLIKANVPSRIACTVASQIDSRTILDIAGAEKLIGRGDMLFAPVGSSKPMRVQGAFVSEAEVERIVTFIKENNTKAKYNADFISKIEEEAAKCGMSKKGAAAGGGMSADFDGGSDGEDSKFRDAVKLAIEEGKISTSLMQRRLGVGYGRAAKIIDTMEEMGYVSKPDGNKPRRVLITMDEYMRRVVNNDLGSDEDETAEE